MKSFSRRLPLSLSQRRPNWLVMLIAFALLAVCALPSPADAQVLYGSLVGTVTDETGAAIPGATVTITHSGTGASRETATDSTGAYRFPTVQSGTYTVAVTLSGFRTFTRTEVPVTLNNITRVDASLQVGQLSETVTVSAETPVLQTERAEVRAELKAREFVNLPVSLNRNYQYLFRVLPGFTPPAEAHSVPSNPSRALVFNVNGASRSSNNIRIDGVSTTNIWLPHVAAYVPALESLEAVNVVTSSFDAEQGMAGGAAVTVITKSGTNALHGTLFEFLRNSALDARNFFDTGDQPPPFKRNQFGGNIGGPIRKDRTFFFFNYEGLRQGAAQVALPQQGPAEVRVQLGKSLLITSQEDLQDLLDDEQAQGDGQEGPHSTHSGPGPRRDL